MAVAIEITFCLLEINLVVIRGLIVYRKNHRKRRQYFEEKVFRIHVTIQMCRQVGLKFKLQINNIVNVFENEKMFALVEG